MNSTSRLVSSLFLATALASSVVGTACAHHYYRAYDPYYSDYHVWNDNEVIYYHQWAREYHRDDNRDFRKLPPEDRRNTGPGDTVTATTTRQVSPEQALRRSLAGVSGSAVGRCDCFLAGVRGVVGDSNGEVDGDSGFGLDRLSVLEIRLEAPLTDGLLRRGSQYGGAAKHAQVFNVAIGPNDRL